MSLMFLLEESLWTVIEEGNKKKKKKRHNSEHDFSDKIQFTGDVLRGGKEPA